MKPLIIKSDPNTLEINFNPESGILEMGGKSMPENARLFFNELKEWIENYIKTDPPKTVMHVKISYLNSGSTGYIPDVFKKLKPLYDSGRELNIKWYFETDDRELEEMGKECSQMSQIPFEMISVENL